MLSQSQQMIVNVIRGRVLGEIGRVDNVKIGSEIVARVSRCSLDVGSKYRRLDKEWTTGVESERGQLEFRQVTKLSFENSPDISLRPGE